MIPPQLRMELDALARHRDAGGRIAVLLDFDGTLSPIVERPELARPAPGATEALSRLIALPRVRVGVISGRALDDLERRLGMDGIDLCGSGGLECRFAGCRDDHPGIADARASAAGAADELGAVCARYPGSWIERKPAGFTLHFRAVEDAPAIGLVDLARTMLERHGDRLRVLDGPRALEVSVNLGWTKGTAVRRLCAEPPARPFYAGDSENDADALSAASELGGIAVGIGSAAPREAAHRLADPQSLVAVLSQWAARLGAGST